MPEHLHRDLDNLSRELLEMGAMVEEATNKAITAVVRRRMELAREVIEGDGAINEKENRIEDQALKLLALHQPVAGDLRFIITALKVNNDLERMGDLAANVCERVETILAHDPLPIPERFETLVTSVQSMVQDSLNALVDRDAVTARRVCEVDDTVDEINREVIESMLKYMHEEPEHIEAAVATMSISRHLERVADLATNIAEDVIFMVKGEIVRHRF